MHKFSSWICLFVMLFSVFVFSGCGGSGSNGGGSNTENGDNPVSTPEPTPNNNIETTPTPTPNGDTSNNTYTDTYDIASVMNGRWLGDSGSGTATGAGGTYGLLMYSMNIHIDSTHITGLTGDNGVSYITYRQYWDCDNGTGYTTRVLLYGDAERVNMKHIGSDEWQCEFSDGTVVVIMFTSNHTAIVSQEGVATISDNAYRYSVRYTIRK